MNNALIVIIIVAALVLIDFAVKVYLTKENAKLNGTKEDKEKVLSDFLFVISNIARESLEILDAEKTMTPDTFEDLLAKKVLDTFKKTVGEYYKNTYIIEIVNVLPEEFIIKWIKDNVFTLDEFAASIKEKLEKATPQTNILNEINKVNQKE